MAASHRAEQPVDPTLTDAELSEAVGVGNIPTLLLVLAHLSGDGRWLGEEFRPSRTVALNDNDSGGLADEVQADVRAAALETLRAVRDGRASVPAPPADDRLVAMLSFSLGESVPAEYGPSMAEEAGFRSPAQVAWTAGRPPDADHYDVLVIGAGVSGLATAIGLRSLGIAVTVVERADQVGGVWQENTYPGAGVDTPAHLYSLSFAPNRSWSRYYAKQPEVRAYLEDVVAEYGLDEVIRFGTEVVVARWDDAAQRWTVTLRDADGERTVTPRVVVSCVGNLNQPAVPDLPGREEFTGPAFHSARWPQDLDVTDRRVAVIGTGATAMQIVPAVADDAAHVTVFQRTPQWVVPNPNYLRSVPPGIRTLMERTPYYASFYRLRLVWQFQDKLLATLRRDPDWPHPERSVSAANDKHRAFITAAVEERLGDDLDRLRDRVVPSYPPYFKRILMDNEWFDTIRRDDVELVCEPIDRLDPDAVVTTSGQRHDADVVVYATGFHSRRLLYPMEIVGRSGESLRDRWGDDDADAHLGITVPDFPNFFVLGGPHTTLAHGGSGIFASECARAHVLGLLTTMIENGTGSVEVREDVAKGYAARVDAEHEQLIWTPPGAGNRKSDRTRHRIIAAAADVLNRRGFDGARLTEIAELAELRVPTVYYYFESREAILEEVVMVGVRLAMDHVHARLGELPATTAPIDRICAAFGAHLEMVLTASQYTAAAMRTLGSLPADVRERQLRQQRAYGDLWRRLVADAVDAGDLDPALDPHGARMLLLGAMNWAPEWWDPDRGSLVEIVGTAQQLVRNALTTHRTARPAVPTPLAPAFRPPPPAPSPRDDDPERTEQ